MRKCSHFKNPFSPLGYWDEKTMPKYKRKNERKNELKLEKQITHKEERS